MIVDLTEREFTFLWTLVRNGDHHGKDYALACQVATKLLCAKEAPADGEREERVLLPTGEVGVIKASWSHNRGVGDRMCNVWLSETGPTRNVLLSDLKKAPRVETAQPTNEATERKS